MTTEPIISRHLFINDCRKWFITLHIVFVESLVRIDTKGLRAFFRKLFGRPRKTKVSCTLDNTLYAYRIEPLQELSKGKNLFTYFVVFTKFGLSDYGKGIINNVYFRLTFEPIINDLDFGIEKITPDYETLEVGKVEVKEKANGGKGGEAAAGLSAGIDTKLVKANLNLNGQVKKKSESEVITTYTYPKKILRKGRAPSTFLQKFELMAILY